MTLRSPEWYRRQADKMLEAAEAAERLEALADDDHLPHGTVIRFTKEYPGVGPCVYTAIKVKRETGNADGWYRSGRHTAATGMQSYSWRALLEWIGIDHLSTIEVMTPDHRLLERGKEA